MVVSIFFSDITWIEIPKDSSNHDAFDVLARFHFMKVGKSPVNRAAFDAFGHFQFIKF